MSKIAGDQSIATESVGKVPTDVDGKEKYSSPTEMLQEPGNEFGLDYRAAFHGCSGDTEPSLATIKFLIDKVEDEDIPVVYTIDFGTKKVAAVVSECTGAAVDTLYSMQTVSRADFDAGETYLTLMERNYEALRKGLNE